MSHMQRGAASAAVLLLLLLLQERHQVHTLLADGVLQVTNCTMLLIRSYIAAVNERAAAHAARHNIIAS
jgi:hypothetical protein